MAYFDFFWARATFLRAKVRCLGHKMQPRLGNRGAVLATLTFCLRTGLIQDKKSKNMSLMQSLGVMFRYSGGRLGEQLRENEKTSSEFIIRV